jgi:hypothetical protein
MLSRILTVLTLLVISQFSFAEPSELELLYCRIELGITVQAAKHRNDGVSFEDAENAADEILSNTFKNSTSDLSDTLKKGLKSKVRDVYFLYPLSVIQKESFSNNTLANCMSSLVSFDNQSLTTDERFFKKMALVLKLSMAGRFPQEELTSFSEIGSQCMLDSLKSENHKAVDEFITLIADDNAMTDAKKLIMQKYNGDPSVAAAFVSANKNTQSCAQSKYNK